MREITRRGVADSFARLLGVKGPPGLHHDGTLISTADMIELARRTPFSNIAAECEGQEQAAAVAGEFGYIWVSPNVNTVLEITRAWSGSSSGGGLHQLMYLTQAQQGTVGVDAFSRMFRTRPTTLDTPDFPENVGSVIDRGTHAAIIGSAIGRMRVPAANTMVLWDFTDNPIYLLGVKRRGETNEGGMSIPALAIVNTAANSVLDAWFICREWQVADL